MIDPALVKALEAVPELAVRSLEPAAKHTVWRVGGAFELYLVAETREAVCAAATLCSEHGEKLRALPGEQLLVRDGGQDGVWIRPGACSLGVARDEGGLRVGAWHPAAAVAGFAERQALAGLDALADRAGTVLDAWRDGAFSGVLKAWVLRGSRVAELTADRLRPHHLVFELLLHAEPGRPAAVRAAHQKAAGRRRATGVGRPGQAMAEPRRDVAAELMWDAGVAGVRLRGARLGSHEVNVVLNQGGATARDVGLLLQLVRDRVNLRSGVELEANVRPQGRN